jgi:phage terminase large subunit GpA-like protein
MPQLTDHERPAKIRRLQRAAAEAIRPADDIEIDAWAETSVELSHRVTARSGRLRLEPYQRRPLQCIKHFVRTVLIWATQTGKTIMLQCFMGWAVDQYPGPFMYVAPDQNFAKRRSTKHLRPFLRDSPVLARHIPPDRHALQVYEYHLNTMSVTVAWAGSPSQMAGEPIMLLARDEFDKYADATDTEANAFRLVERRTASYGPLRRIFDATTPTVEQADGWKALIGGTWEEFFVPCPHCAREAVSHDTVSGLRNPGWQVLEFSQFRYPKREKAADEPEEICDWQARVRRDTVYECRDCGQAIRETLRWSMVRRGQWHARQPEGPYPSFHLPSWYARTPVNSFGEVAARYVEGLEDPEAMRDWCNNDAALPYSDAGHNARQELVRAHVSEDYARGTIPTREPCIVVATADLHKLCHFVTVWALTPSRTYLIDWHKVETPEEIGELRRTLTYRNLDDVQYGIDAAFADAGYRPADVYALALEDAHVIPITGSGRSGLVSWTTATHYPKSDRELDRPIDCLNVSDTHFKEQLLLRFESGVSEEGFRIEETDWLLPSDTPGEFLRHMLGEAVLESKNSHGYTVREWQKIGPNHYFDCAKYALAARYVLAENLRALRRSDGPPAAGPTAESRVSGSKPVGWD